MKTNGAILVVRLAILLLLLPPLAQRAKLDISTATIPELQAAMQKGSLTSEKQMQRYLARIHAYDRQGPKLNAVILLSQVSAARLPPPTVPALPGETLTD